MPFDRDALKQRLAVLATRNIFVGTSSWKYSGWKGLLYDEARYVYRSKFAESRFERLCLTEYAEVFKTVCVDAAYYKFPDQRYLEGLVAQVPSLRGGSLASLEPHSQQQVIQRGPRVLARQLRQLALVMRRL